MFDPVFMRLALVASIATGVALGVMGVYLVIRRLVFLGLVVANAAASEPRSPRSSDGRRNSCRLPRPLEQPWPSAE